MTTVFVSHASEDAATARTIASAIRDAGWSVWMAPESIPPGVPYDEAIVGGLRGCDMLAVLVSSSANGSRHVRREVALADEFDKMIVPIRLEPVALAAGLAFYLGLPQWIEWHEGGVAALQPLLPRVPEPPPPRPPKQEPEAAEQSAVIEVRRNKSYTAGLRKVAIFVDGRKSGEVGNGQALRLEVSGGEHEVQAKLDWYSSEPLFITVTQGAPRVVEVALPAVSDLKRQLASLTGGSGYLTCRVIQ